MARVWLNQRGGGGVWPEDVPAPPWLALRMRMISDGRLLPTNDRDHAALAVLREEQAPATPCATCGGTTKDTDVRLCEETDCPDCRPEVTR